MTQRDYEITQGAELPDIPFDWRDSERQVIPFASGWTFRLVLAEQTAPATLVLSKTSAILGFDTAPNVVATFPIAGELNLLTPGDYLGELWALRTVDSKERGPFKFRLVVLPRLGP